MSIVRRASSAAFAFVALVGAPSIFAAGGWYLVVPPRSDYDELKGYKILDSKPLSQWTQQGAYDSASECEAVKNSLLTVEQNSYYTAQRNYGTALDAKKDPAVLAVMHFTLQNYRSNYDGLTASRCIKSDDPRLGK